MAIPLKDRAKGIYLSSLDKSELSGMLSELFSYLNNDAVKRTAEANGEIGRVYGIIEALYYRLGTKLYLLRYMEGYRDSDGKYHPKYARDSLDMLSEHINTALSVATERGYKNTAYLAANVRDFKEATDELISPLIAKIDRLYVSGELDGEDKDTVKRVRGELISAKDRLASLDKLPLFPEDVAMPELIKGVISDIDATVARLDRDLGLQVNGAMLKLLSGNLISLAPKEEPGFYEMPFDEERTDASCFFVSTPIEGEAELFASVLSGSRGIHVSKLSAVALSKIKPDEIASLFEVVCAKGMNLFISDLEQLGGAALDAALIGILSMSEVGAYAIVMDNGGEKKLYRRLLELCRAAQRSDLGVIHLYLKMPNFDALFRTLITLGIIEDSEQSKARVRAKLPFVGFDGINTAIEMTSGKLDMAERISSENTAAAVAYLARLEASRLLIDSGWGDFSGHIRFSGGERLRFDYDGIRDVDLENVKKIVNSSATTFAKCGMLSKYCTLAGEDVGVWERLETSERSERVRLATHLVARLLSCENVPEVEIIPRDKWEGNSTAGGLCINGGKRIVYREDCALDYDWMIDAICHEVFHSFQATARSSGYTDWFFSELGVTDGRIQEWNNTRTRAYDTNTKSDVYYVHVYEADARAFAADCISAAKNFWHKIDFN